VHVIRLDLAEEGDGELPLPKVDEPGAGNRGYPVENGSLANRGVGAKTKEGSASSDTGESTNGGEIERRLTLKERGMSSIPPGDARRARPMPRHFTRGETVYLLRVWRLLKRTTIRSAHGCSRKTHDQFRLMPGRSPLS
jgi:hypothetical protein